MICQECNQRPATLHFTKIINGEKTEVIFVRDVLRKKGNYLWMHGGHGFSINNLLAGLFNMESNIQQPKAMHFQKRKTTLPELSAIFKEFVQIGKFGCAKCYETFNEQLNPILKRVHSGNTAHIGKIPKRIGGTIHLEKTNLRN